MLIFTELGLHPIDEVRQIKEHLILDDDESTIFDMAVRNKSAQEMAFATHRSPRTIYRMLKVIRTKIFNYYKYIG